MKRFASVGWLAAASVVGLVAALGWGVRCESGDWPQILGPGRDGQAAGESIEPWAGEPKLKWRVACGAGYAGVAVSDGKVLLWHRVGDEECLDCLDAADGKRLWRAAFPASYRGGVDPDKGPRCVPVVTADRVIVYGAAGNMHAVKMSDGKPIWSRGLRDDYDAEDGYFGFGSTPIVVGDVVIAAVGGRDGAGIVGVKLADGKTLWKGTDEKANYSSPVLIRDGNEDRVLVVMSLRGVMLRPETGELLGRFDFGRRGPVVNAATPLVDGSRVFVTSSYGIGCRMVDMSSDPPRDLWKSQEVISSQYATPVRVGDHLYAITGREDIGDAGLLCVRFDDGEVAWEQPGYGTAHLIAAGDRIIAQKTDGKIELFAAEPKAFRSLAVGALPEGTYKALPALSNRVLFCRRGTSSREGELLAIGL